MTPAVVGWSAGQGLEALKRQAREAPGASAPAVAREFEALFLNLVMQRMRDATPRDGLFNNEQTRLMQSLLDSQLAQAMATRGVGLAAALLAQMPRDGTGHANLDGAMDTVLGARETPVAPGGATGVTTGMLDAIRAGRQAADVLPGVARVVPPGATGALALPDGAAPHVAGFLQRLGDAARTVAQASGLPLRLILGQAALESDWGQREIRHADGRPSHNLFGIKATPGWTGEVVRARTTEFVAGSAARVTEAFRAYGSYEEALGDYARLLTRTERYRAVRESRSEAEAARHVQAAGYATDPDYAAKLIRVMRQLPL